MDQASPTEAPVYAAPEDLEERAASERLVLATRQWVDATNKAKIDVLRRVYADTVKIYGATLSSLEAAKRKVAVHGQNPGIREELVGPLEIDSSNPSQPVVRFRKRVYLSTGVTEYEAYLAFAQVETGYLIVVESDRKTDYDLHKSPASIACENSVRRLAQAFVTRQFGANLGRLEPDSETYRGQYWYSFYLGLSQRFGEYSDGSVWTLGHVHVDARTALIEVSCVGKLDCSHLEGTPHEVPPDDLGTNVLNSCRGSVDAG